MAGAWLRQGGPSAAEGRPGHPGPGRGQGRPSSRPSWGRIDEQGPRWPALFEAWVRRKKSSKIHVATGGLRALLPFLAGDSVARRSPDLFLV